MFLKGPVSKCLSRLLERAKLANLQILKCILKRAKALLPKVAKLYRCLYGGGYEPAPAIQTSVKFSEFSELNNIFISLKQIIQNWHL